MPELLPSDHPWFRARGKEKNPSDPFYIVYLSGDNTVKTRGPYLSSNQARAKVPSGIEGRSDLWTMARKSNLEATQRAYREVHKGT